MPKFYYIYDNRTTQPYKNGWTEIEADTISDAHAAFRRIHPNSSNTNQSELDCARIYNEDEFNAHLESIMAMDGARCHEYLNVTVKTNEQTLSEYINANDTFELNVPNRPPIYNNMNDITVFVTANTDTYKKLCTRTIGVTPDDVSCIRINFGNINAAPHTSMITADGSYIAVPVYRSETLHMVRAFLKLIQDTTYEIEDKSQIRIRLNEFL